MDIDKEDPPTNSQASSKTHGRTTQRIDKDIRGVNIALLPQIHVKGPRPEPSLKGKKRATLEEEEEEEEEETVCVQLKLIAHN
jgi:hypothetical protein